MKTIKVKKLTKEAFAPYGEVLTIEGREAGGNPASHLWYPQVVVIDNPTSINLMKVIPHEFVLKDFEAHDHTTENLLAMDGDLIVGMAPAGDLQGRECGSFLHSGRIRNLPETVCMACSAVCSWKRSHERMYL